ncbi:4185_t:CDS:2, partial [Dentiscutata heterogama]
THSNLSVPSSLYDSLDPATLTRHPKRTESAPDISEFTLNQKNTSLINKAFPDTPQQYLDKLRDTLSKSELATLLAKSKDVFHEAVLRTYMETFNFRNDPIDIALRKFLLDCYLPKETQQIDRVMEAFAKRYHECNPDVFASSDVAYVLAFAMLMLHTDAFNKSVKRKMTKDEFVNNTRIDGVPREILEILYDNITFARFIYADDDTDVNGQTMLTSPSENRRSRIFGSLKDRRKSSFVKNDP